MTPKLNNYCKDCGTLIWSTSERCHRCADFKRRKPKKYCIDCGVEIKGFYAIRCGRCWQKNEKNPQWKGDDVGYTALHNWVKRNKSKPKLCECCKKKPPYDLANISGEYKRDLDDWEWICRSCHMKKDGRMKKFIEMINKIKGSLDEKYIARNKYMKIYYKKNKDKYWRINGKWK